MATVGTINSLPSYQQTNGTGNSQGNGTTAGQAGADGLANESTFLQLLVAQLQNQDPASPMDGTTFVTQLAQFSDLEQNLAMRQDLDALSSKYAGTSSQTASANQSGTSTDAGSKV
jgi:flagellar basal-body rod modification protein FlgD